MPDPLPPPIFIEEARPAQPAIEGVSTSTAGMLGMTERGPETPQLVTGVYEFERWYGRFIPESYLPDAIRGFFDNGGQRCVVSRVVGVGATAASLTGGTYTWLACGRGAWGNRVRVKIDAATNATAKNRLFRVSVLYFKTPPADKDFVDPTAARPPDPRGKPPTPPDVLEVYDNLTHLPEASNNVATTINANSKLVRVLTGKASARPKNQAFTALAHGSDGAAVTPADFGGDVEVIGGQEVLGKGRGLAALATIREVSLLLAPDEVRPGLAPVTDLVLSQCEQLRDRFGLVSALEHPGPLDQLAPPRNTSYGAFYFPWIEVYDLTASPSTPRATRIIPPTGHIAGIFARVDRDRGVHKAPTNESVQGIVGLQVAVSQVQQDILNPKGVNCLRAFPGRGIGVWGARTMTSDSEWKYVPVRRLAIFIEESIFEGLQWVVFEPNDQALWSRLIQSISVFLSIVWRNGALAGVRPEEAFFVKCDRTTMTQTDIELGHLICLVGIAPVRPAEFIILRFQWQTASTNV